MGCFVLGTPIEGDEDTKQDINNPIYITWGFFEDFILNPILGLVHEDKFKFGAKFDSANTFITYSKELVDKQKLYGQWQKQPNLSFIYPEEWGDTYSTRVKKTPDGRRGNYTSSYKHNSCSKVQE